MSDSSKAKIPPSSKESEMMVLGCMLTSIGSLNVAADLLEESDFYYSEHKIVFDALRSCYKQDKPADVHLVSEELKRMDKLKAAGGISYLTTLAQYAGTSAYIEEYADLVRNKSLLRRMVHAAQEVEKTALEEPENVHEALDQAQQKFFHISQTANPVAGIHIKEIITGAKAASKLPYLKELQEKQEKFQTRGPDDPGITGIPTHYVDLDKLINGLSPSNLMIVAGRPAMGKTAFALNVAESVCFKNNLPVGIFSLEMTAEQLLHRIICSQSEVESDKIKTGSLNGVEFQRVVAAVNMMQKHTMIIDDQPGLKITDLRARARRMKEAHGIELLIVDYLQLLSGSGYSRNVENRQNEISEISRLLKTLARELNVPVICASQLSRKVEERTGHRPMMSDLRESGCLTGDALIQDADTGKFYTIKELAERKEQKPIFVHAIDKELKIGKHRMIKAFYSGKKTVYELKTRTGRSIKASANHPFRKSEEWRRLDQLHPGDMICVTPAQNTEYYSGTTALMPFFKKIFKAPSKEIFWDEIISIKELGVEDVYDATVENVHNFVANDILVHNSIEQDADLVILLFRREYYDPYDKPGVAEIIVAKNRHGAVGSVNLTYRKELAQFANFSPTHTASTSDDNRDAFAAFSPGNND